MSRLLVLLFASIVIATVSLDQASAFFEQGWQNVFCNIKLFGMNNTISCDNMKDTITLKEGQDISLDFDNSTDTITISATTTLNEIKSGSALIQEGICATVSFNSSFGSTPAVTVSTVSGVESPPAVSTINNITSDDFDICVSGDGMGGIYSINWIATTAGNP